MEIGDATEMRICRFYLLSSDLSKVTLRSTQDPSHHDPVSIRLDLERRVPCHSYNGFCFPRAKETLNLPRLSLILTCALPTSLLEGVYSLLMLAWDFRTKDTALISKVHQTQPLDDGSIVLAITLPMQFSWNPEKKEKST